MNFLKNFQILTNGSSGEACVKQFSRSGVSRSKITVPGSVDLLNRRVVLLNPRTEVLVTLDLAPDFLKCFLLLRSHLQNQR